MVVKVSKMSILLNEIFNEYNKIAKDLNINSYIFKDNQDFDCENSPGLFLISNCSGDRDNESTSYFINRSFLFKSLKTKIISKFQIESCEYEKIKPILEKSKYNWEVAIY